MNEADRRVEVTNEAIFWRGQFIHRHSGIEFAVSELLTRARLLEQYSTIKALPFHWDKRVKMLRSVLEMDGPLRDFSSRLFDPVSQLCELEQYRHLMVHGILAVGLPLTLDKVVRFKMFGWPQRGQLGLISLDITMKELVSLAQRVAPLATAVTGLVAELCRTIPLPKVSASEPIPLE